MLDGVLFTSAWVAAMLAIAHPSATADPDPAEALFNQGVDDMDARRFEKVPPGNVWEWEGTATASRGQGRETPPGDQRRAAFDEALSIVLR